MPRCRSRSWTKPPASVARSACRSARWMRSWAQADRCIPSCPPNASAADCASRRARWTASRWWTAPLARQVRPISRGPNVPADGRLVGLGSGTDPGRMLAFLRSSWSRATERQPCPPVAIAAIAAHSPGPACGAHRAAGLAAAATAAAGVGVRWRRDAVASALACSPAAWLVGGGVAAVGRAGARSFLLAAAALALIGVRQPLPLSVTPLSLLFRDG